jgi:hypothetical protein
MLPNELFRIDHQPLDLSHDKKFKLAALRTRTTWTCARCGVQVSSMSPKRLRRLARKHAESHGSTGV